MSRKYTVEKHKGRWWVIRPNNHPKKWIAEWVGVTWTEAMTQARRAAMNSANENWQQYCDEVDRYVETHYGHVMAPYQRDLVKRVAKGDLTQTSPPARPYIHRHCQRIAKEVVAVICAGQTNE